MTKALGLVFFSLILVLAVATPAASQITYTTKLTSGPFLVAPSAASVDWAVVNNGTAPADLRVTVYKLDLLGEKVAVAPGAVVLSLAPGRTSHNANSVGSVFLVGFYYEVVVESTADDVHPNVNQWSDFSGGFIPGTLIPAGSFVNIKMPKPPKPPKP